VVIAILDDGGHLLGSSAWDALRRRTRQIAIEKGRTAAVSRRTTRTGKTASRRAHPLLNMPVLPVQGGVPIMVNGECAGAVGVSGVQSHEDEQIANAGIAALG